FGLRCGIFNRELVIQGVIGSAREPFHEMELFAGSAVSGQVREVGCVDNKRVAFPMTYRVALPQAHALWDVRSAVRGDHARRVVDFVNQRYVTWPLDNL